MRSVDPVITPVVANTNSELKTLLTGFTVDGETVATAFLKYDGHGEPYVVYTQYDEDNSYSTDDEIAGYVVYYDFDIYTTGNYLAIVNALKRLLKSAGWTWEPSRDSPSMYEPDTGYFHKTLCFCKPIQEVELTETTNTK